MNRWLSRHLLERHRHSAAVARALLTGGVSRRAARSARARTRRRRARAATRGRRPANPCARACTSTLPIAVASTGPASTGSPDAVGGQLAQQLVERSAADDVDRVDIDCPTALDAVRTAPANASARLSMIDAHELRPARGYGDSRARRTTRRCEPGMSPGARNRGSFASNTATGAATAAAAASSSASSTVVALALPLPHATR